MSENLPDSFDPKQPDLPSLAVDPDPVPDTHEAQETGTEPLEDGSAS